MWYNQFNKQEFGVNNALKKILISVLKTALFFIGWALLAGFLPVPSATNPAIWRLWAEVMPLVAIIGLTLVFWLVEKRQVHLHLFNNSAKGLLIGTTAGIVWLGCVVIVLLSIGAMKIDGSNEVSQLLIWILAAFLNVVMQELLVRGYLYQMIKHKHNVVAATIVTTALFTFMHAGAFEVGLIPVLNVVTMSLLMTIALEYTGSIIAPIMMHSIWNCVGAIILDGVSLADDYPHLLNSTLTGSDILSGGACKIEGSIIVLAVNVLMIVLFSFMKRKKSN